MPDSDEVCRGEGTHGRTTGPSGIAEFAVVGFGAVGIATVRLAATVGITLIGLGSGVDVGGKAVGVPHDARKMPEAIPMKIERR